MSTSTSQDLLLAVRSGKVSEVISLLDADLARLRPLDLVPALATACFLGHCAIVRELVDRGAPLNLPSGLASGEPLAMAIKGQQRNVIRQLIGLGAQVPPGLDTGLSGKELADAQQVARRRLGGAEHAIGSTDAKPLPTPAPTAVAQASESPSESQLESPLESYSPIAEDHPLASLSSPRYPPTAGAPDSSEPSPPPQVPAAVEEIEMTACYGVDTSVLESDLLRSQPGAAQAREEMVINAPELDLGVKQDAGLEAAQDATPALKKRWTLPFFPAKKSS